MAVGGGGGSDDDDGSGGATVELRGTAATGLAIIGIVYVTDSTGIQINVPTAANGDFAVDITGMTGPFIIRAVPNNSNLPTQYSYATAAGTVNVTSLTTLALFIATGQTNLAALERGWAGRSAEVVLASLRRAQAIIKRQFRRRFCEPVHRPGKL